MLQLFSTMAKKYSYPSVQQNLLFRADYPHQDDRSCHNCDKRQIVERAYRRNENPKFHYDTIESANTVVKNANLREKLRRELKIICLEMKTTELIDSFPCLMIREICDYADSHKNKKWQPYAAATAAACMKVLLSAIPPQDVAEASPAAGLVQMLRSDSIFLPQRLLHRSDVNLFLDETFRRDGVVRALLHGLPGVGYFYLLRILSKSQFANSL
jgi:hypothetical protein